MIHLFLSLLYAEPHELGWDLTMVMSHDGQQVDITVFSEHTSPIVYRTLELLSGSSTQGFGGRGTRVWKAVKLEDGHECGEPVALKDCWVDPACKPEAKNIEAIREATSTAEARSTIDRLLPDVVCHGDVFVDVGLKILDYTRIFAFTEQTEQQTSCARTRCDITREQQQRRAKSPLVHYRIVYKQVGQNTLHQESSLATIFGSLVYVATG